MSDYNVKINYYDNEIQISLYGYTITTKKDKGDQKNETCEQSVLPDQQYSVDNQEQSEVDPENKVRSLRRTKQTIYDYARSNKWDYFCTFTFKEDRFDYLKCCRRLTRFFDNMKQRHVPDLQYLAVPETHKDGAFHFHALISGSIRPLLVESWRSGRYEFKNYTLGKCEVERVKDSNRASNYITKYITKDLQDILMNKRRFLVSRGLRKSEEQKMMVKKKDHIDFILNNFPEYDITYSNSVSYNDNMIQYIQLKRRVEDDF